MLCPRCYGTHFVVESGQWWPCPDCGGMGEIHCCDGLTEQPDPDGDRVRTSAPCPVPIRSSSPPD